MIHEDILNYVESKKEYIDTKELETLSNILNNMHLNEKKKLETIKQKGDLEFRKGNYKKAIEYYSTYLSMNKENHIIYSNRAASYHKLDMVDEAIEDCKEGLRLCPTFSKFYLRLGVLCKDHDSSISYLEMGLQVDPENEVIKEQLESKKSINSPTIRDLLTEEGLENVEEILKDQDKSKNLEKLVEGKSHEEAREIIKKFIQEEKNKD